MKVKTLLFLILVVNTLNANEIVKIIPPQSAHDTSHNYFSTLLQLILNENQIKIKHTYQMEQGRAFVQLKKNQDIDIYWAGTSPQREEQFNAIKIPLLKGLLGYRVLIINKNNTKIFDNVKSIQDLKKLKACQGKHWPDTKILENSNFNVIRNSNYESMFLQVLKGRCDYFPRGIHEGYSEIEARKLVYKDLKIYDGMIIYYPFPMYFFVSKENKNLAKIINNGLLKLIENGGFEKHLKNHEVTKHLFPLSNWQKNSIFTINNHLLSKEIDYHNNKFWILPFSTDK